MSNKNGFCLWGYVTSYNGSLGVLLHLGCESRMIQHQSNNHVCTLFSIRFIQSSGIFFFFFFKFSHKLDRRILIRWWESHIFPIFYLIVIFPEEIVCTLAYISDSFFVLQRIFLCSTLNLYEVCRCNLFFSTREYVICKEKLLVVIGPLLYFYFLKDREYVIWIFTKFNKCYVLRLKAHGVMAITKTKGTGNI